MNTQREQEGERNEVNDSEERRGCLFSRIVLVHCSRAETNN